LREGTGWRFTALAGRPEGRAPAAGRGRQGHEQGWRT
jgi:hypothetical protein